MQGEMFEDKVACPQCGREGTVTVMPFIDGSDPEQQEKFFTGAVNIFRCGQCGAEMLLSSLFEYVDPSRAMAYVAMPETALESDEFFADFADDGTLLYADRSDEDLALLPPYLRYRRVVFSYRELLAQAHARMLFLALSHPLLKMGVPVHRLGGLA